MNNSYTNTAQKLLNACKQACTVVYKEQLKQHEEAIQMALLSEQNPDEENSQSGVFIDNESTPSVFHDNESYDAHPTTSSSANMATPTMNKKPKLNMNKNRVVSNKSSVSNLATDGQLTSNKLKNKQFFFASMPSNKNSPRSGSDAEVFVDVESIDDRGFPLLNHVNFNRKNISNQMNRNNYEDEQNSQRFDEEDMSNNYQDYQ